MQLGIDSHIPDGLLAANALLAENSRQGFGAWSGTVHQGFEFAISSTSLGIKGSLYDGGIGSRYTGKERDTESGLDYFGARYYASSMGRWMSPDWSDDDDPVPYADLSNPQSLNLYGYVNNNPLSKADPDGHCPECVLEAIEEGIQEGEDAGMGDAGPEGALIGGAIGGTVAAGGLIWDAVHNFFQPTQPNSGPVPPQPNAEKEHTSNPRPSNLPRHEKGQGRKKKDKGGEKGDVRRRQNGMYGRKPPPGHKGPWPPRGDNNNFNLIPLITPKDNSTVTTTEVDRLPPPPPPPPPPPQQQQFQ